MNWPSPLQPRCLNPFEFRASFGPAVNWIPFQTIRLNPFEFRASFGLLWLSRHEMSEGLNPFEFRASFGRLPNVDMSLVFLVLIPLNSGLHLDQSLGNVCVGSGSLNPFEFRASFGRSMACAMPSARRSLNPFEFRASFGRNPGMMSDPVTGLNPFEFRASFGRSRREATAMATVLIPLNSGLHLDPGRASQPPVGRRVS